MWDRDLVSRLSPKASQVLLSLLLSRSPSVQYSSAEFAKLTGLSHRSIGPALLELRSAGLIQIIPQPGKPPVVRLVHPEEVRSETVVVEVSHEDSGPHLDSGGRPALAPVSEGTPIELHQNAGEGRGGADAQGRSQDDGLAIEQGLLNNCQFADQGQDVGLRIAALQDVWAYAFPVKDYPYQRLTNDAARRLLKPPGQVSRSAEWVGGVILKSARNATSRIMAPLSYMQAALAGEEKRSAQAKGGGEDGNVINDELRRLAQLGKEQFGEKGKDSG